MTKTHAMNREQVVALVQDMEAQLAQAERNVIYADKAAEAYERQRDGLLAACEKLCDTIERVGYSDKLEAILWDEDDAEEKTWRSYVPKCELEAYDSAKIAVAKAKGDD